MLELRAGHADGRYVNHVITIRKDPQLLCSYNTGYELHTASRTWTNAQKPDVTTQAVHAVIWEICFLSLHWCGLVWSVSAVVKGARCSCAEHKVS